ncbi:transglycosylase SLT domain-containing protein [Mycolicibacterium tusciae]|uniref:transglycosylase SLT domain-containing protein n=1 Tax=Mycolicibacterium tusciae TaxID=75922 RepID=UPI0011E557A4|nr:transglycosylase SLT domain-containing protein [Mycolicibacterium tusciae]
MGQARDGFGTGVGVLLPVAPLGPAPPPSITPGEGQAADGQQDSAVEHHNSTAALDALDATGRAELDAAGASASGGRGNMESIIAAAVADVQALGLSTNTPEGKRALIAAIKTRLEETRGTVQTGAAEAGTHAASANANAAGYGDVAGLTRPAGMGANPLGAMPMSGGMPMGGGGMPGFGAPLSGLSGLTAPFTQAAKLTGSNGSPAAGTGGSKSAVSQAAKIPLSAVRYDRQKFPAGRDAYRGYISEALDVMGVDDPRARARWMTGLMTAAARESSFNPLAVNTSDMNATRLAGSAADGFPAGSSRGGVQTIPETFASFHQPGTATNIYEPVANLCASMNYVMSRYGVDPSGSNLSKVAQFNPNSAGGGY